MRSAHRNCATAGQEHVRVAVDFIDWRENMKVMMTNVGNVDRLGLDRYQNFGLGTISASGTNTNQYLRAEQTALGD